MPRNILHLLGTAQPEGTGIARIAAAIAARLDPERYRTDIWFLGNDGPLSAELGRAGAGVLVIGWGSGVRDPAGAFRFWRHLRRKRFAVVHQHYGGRSVSALIRAATRAALLIHVHGQVMESGEASGTPIHIPKSDGVIAASHATAQQILSSKVQVIYSGVDLPDFPRRFSGSKILGIACRLVPIKGVVYAIRAFALLRHEFPEVRLEIAGDGPERALLEREVHSLGLARAVVFLGWHTNLAPLFAKWGALVHPSLDEGLPTVLLEAMAAALPVVATAVGGTHELVIDGQTGWLVPPRDPVSLARRLRDLLIAPRQGRAMGVAARARVSDCFSVERMVGELDVLYEGLLASKIRGQKT
jgi:glycosyltransferase involved in cell wall biosynthesis